MKSDNTWDANPRTMDYKGQKVELFTVSAFAKALNREIVTIRSLERKGVLSKPRLRDGRKWRMYTRGQIEALVQLAEEEGVLNPNYRNPFSARFIREAKAIMNQPPT